MSLIFILNCFTKSYVLDVLLIFILSPSRRQDLHNQAFSLILGCGRWFGVLANFMCSVFVGLVAAVCVLISLDAGNVQVDN